MGKTCPNGCVFFYVRILLSSNHDSKSNPDDSTYNYMLLHECPGFELWNKLWIICSKKLTSLAILMGSKQCWHTETKLIFTASEDDKCKIKITESEVVSEALNHEKIKEQNSIEYAFELKHIDKDKLDIYGTDGYVNPITLTIRA